jgi:hypothetical protein
LISSIFSSIMVSSKPSDCPADPRGSNPCATYSARGEPSPGADVTGMSSVPLQMWQQRAQSRRRCGPFMPASLLSGFRSERRDSTGAARSAGGPRAVDAPFHSANGTNNN